MRHPMLSVIVPVYNTASWLARCLDSICAQTYQDLEILCVNDGSTDNSAEILEEYAAKDSRIKVITQENAGLSAARNTALEHATGEWVTGVDSDDYLAPDVYERAVACLGDEVDLVFFGVQDVDEEGRATPPNPYFEMPAAGVYEMTPELAGQLNACFWSKLWRRSILEENNLRFPHGLVHEDEALYFLVAPLVKRIAVCSDVGYYYVQRSGSIMNSGALTPESRLQRYIPMLMYTCEEFRKKKLLKKGSRIYLAIMFVRLCAYAYWCTGDAEVLRTRCAELVKNYGLYSENYLLERLIPVSGWKRCFLSRYSLSKVYRVFGVACRVVQYSEQGEPVGSSWLIWTRIRRLLRLK